MARAIDAEVAKKRLQAWIDESDAQGFDKEATCFRNCITLLDAVPTLTPPNEPLTLDELREMNGEPVWVVPIGKCKWATRQWCVLAADEALIPGVDHWWWSFEGYGETWIAYRRPPEGEV